MSLSPGALIPTSNFGIIDIELCVRSPRSSLTAARNTTRKLTNLLKLSRTYSHRRLSRDVRAIRVDCSLVCRTFYGGPSFPPYARNSCLFSSVSAYSYSLILEEEKEPNYLNAGVGEYAVFNCDLDFPHETPIPYILQWNRDVSDAIRSTNLFPMKYHVLPFCQIAVHEIS